MLKGHQGRGERNILLQKDEKGLFVDVNGKVMTMGMTGTKAAVALLARVAKYIEEQ